jgi:hypothetical protein
LVRIMPMVPLWALPLPGLGSILFDPETGEPYFEPDVSPVAISPLASPSLKSTISFAAVKHRQFLYGVDLMRGDLTLLASPGGVGKSSIALAIAISIATGRPLLDKKIYGTELSALYINAEDVREEMLRRLWGLCIEHKIQESDLDRLALLGADDSQVGLFSLLRSDKGASVVDDAGFNYLESQIVKFRPAVVVLDPLVALCGGGNMNDNAAMSLVMRGLKNLAAKCDCAFLIVHHTRKGGDLTMAEAIGGASAIVNFARRALMLTPMSAEDARKLGVPPSMQWRYFRVTSAKSNLSPPISDAEWYELRTVVLPNPEPPIYPIGDRVQAVVSVSLPLPISSAIAWQDLAIRKAILDVVDAGKDIDGVAVRYSPSTSGAANIRGLTDDALAAARRAVGQDMHQDDLTAAVDRAIGSLKKEGVLVDGMIGGSGRFRKGRGLSVNWTRAPWAAQQTPDAAATAEDAATAAGSALPKEKK